MDLKNDAAGATPFITVSTADLPEVFDVIPVVDSFYTWYYDLGDISGWADGSYANYHYVDDESAMILIPPEVTLAVDKLLNAGSVPEFEEIWATIPDSVKDLIVPSQMEQLENLYNSFEPITYETAVMVGEIAVPVTVTGHIPETGITLSATLVSNEQVIKEGFDVKPDASDVITALDIKLLKEDGTEWQPADGQQITVTIGVAELGIADERVVTLQHKHGDSIQKYDIFLVLDGKITLYTSGFSIFVVQTATSKVQYGTETHNNNAVIELEVGESRIYYFNGNAGNNSIGTWSVTDTSGAIHYTVHTQSSIGHNGMYCPWLNIDTLKATPEGEDIKLVFNHQNGSETYTLRIVNPVADPGKKLLYLKDDVNATGQLVATLVDDKGNELSLEGAIFTWTRDDDAFISPNAYENDPEDTTRVTNQSINIAKDHGGLVEARKKKDNNGNVIGYQPTTYTCVATLADGTNETASYTVYYQSEFINSAFEFPKAAEKTYTYFPNGYPELYWETTAPGIIEGQLTKDIEYGEVTGIRTGDNTDDSGFGVEHAAEYVTDKSTTATQFAELNAEAVGALYQDIISVPGEFINWSFRHAPRRQQSWNGGTNNRDSDNFNNKMFIVIGATEDAQKLVTQDDLMVICDLAKKQDITVASTPQPVIVNTIVNGKTVTYHVWYHDAGKPMYGNHNQDDFYTAANDYGWTKLSGSYEVPAGQYRTRLFFVSDTADNDYPNFGNLIDTARAGQYKKYLIEYYEESYVVDENGQSHSVFKHIKEKDESGEALIYSFVTLENMEYFLGKQGDYLHTIYINGENYPYSIRYNDVVSMYVEQYAGEADHFSVTNTNYVPNDYEQYDIVMQITLRDTVIAVQKKIQFPAAMSIEQKLKVITELREEDNDYCASFTIHSTDGGNIANPNGTALVTHRDPLTGEYFGYISLGDNPTLEHNYVVTETATTNLPGLILKEVTFATSMYQYGKEQQPATVYYNVAEANKEGKPLSSTPFKLTGKQKIADILVTNVYEEKMTKVNYEAVGKGKVQLQGTEGHVVVGDRPSEYLEFYSGKANGAKAIAGDGASFVGWYTDPACTEESRVTAVNGVYDKVAGTFVPNTNIIEAEEVTFYAKFETGTIIIERTGGEAGETFVYLVTRSHGSTEESFYVTVTCSEDGTGSRRIQEVDEGTYTIQEIGDWSWRHTASSQNSYHNGTETKTFEFGSPVSKDSWLSGWSSLWKNVFEKNIVKQGGSQ